MKIATIESLPLRVPFTAGGGSNEAAWNSTASAATETTPSAVSVGRKPLDDRAVPTGILFVRQSGIPG